MCEYCEGKQFITFNGYTTMHIVNGRFEAYIDDNFGGGYSDYSQNIKYCPMCKRNLQESTEEFKEDWVKPLLSIYKSSVLGEK